METTPLEIRRTEIFQGWVDGLKDAGAAARIAIRIDRAALGNLGDVKYFDGIGEMRITYGPGYRLYFARRGATVVILLAGGDKATQAKDIKRAIELAKEI